MTKKIFIVTLALLMIFSSLTINAQTIGTTIQVNPTKVKVGEQVIASGTTKVDSWVSIKGLDSAGNILYMNFVKSDGSGEWQDQITIPNMEVGTFQLIAGSGVDVATADIQIYKNRPDNDPVNNDPVNNDPVANDIGNDLNGEISDLQDDPIALAGVFPDIVGHWAEAYINKLQGLGIIDGYPDGTIRPEERITRAEAAKTLILAIGKMPSTNEISPEFIDRDSVQDWAKGYVEAALENGILKGFDDHTIRPNDIMSRDQMVAMVMRAYGLGESDQPMTFEDIDKIQDWCSGYISKAVELGIITGYTQDNTFRPARAVTRAEFFKVIAIALEQ